MRKGESEMNESEGDKASLMMLMLMTNRMICTLYISIVASFV